MDDKTVIKQKDNINKKKKKNTRLGKENNTTQEHVRGVRRRRRSCN